MRRMTSTLDEEPKPRTSEWPFGSWEEFESGIRKLDDPNRELWDEVWYLSTTLERRTDKVRDVASYLRLINEIKPAVETFTGGAFPLPPVGEIEQKCQEYDLFHQYLGEYAIYMAHLRHGGFPSPLLDWTSSPYVAAYFAFSRARHAGKVAVYAYRERPANMKIGSSDEPEIMTFGPILKTHKRHFRQQSRYTVCLRYTGGRWYFAPHDRVFGVKSDLSQDALIKMTIPAKERIKALRFFDKFNLNEFTLFDSEEGLLEMLATRVIDMRIT
jgi:hypothetical protein